MVSEDGGAPDPELDDRPCGVCSHLESDHILREVVNTLERRPYCLECDDWHAFVPAPSL